MEAHQNNQRCPSPRNLSFHKQIKDISDLLRPELQRLHKNSQESCGNTQLYVSFIKEIKALKVDVKNQDALVAFHNIISHMQKAIELSQKKALNQEILWHLQEVMAFSFKVQNLPG